jgi:hypothetical protein
MRIFVIFAAVILASVVKARSKPYDESANARQMGETGIYDFLVAVAQRAGICYGYDPKGTKECPGCHAGKCSCVIVQSPIQSNWRDRQEKFEYGQEY